MTSHGHRTGRDGTPPLRGVPASRDPAREEFEVIIDFVEEEQAALLIRERRRDLTARQIGWLTDVARGRVQHGGVLPRIIAIRRKLGMYERSEVPS